jgi:hypothetical protein
MLVATRNDSTVMHCIIVLYFNAQVSTLSAQLDDLMNDARKCLRKFTKECTAERITTIVDKNDTIPKASKDSDEPPHPLSEFIGKPYSTYKQNKGSTLRKELLQPLRNRDHLTKLVFGPILDNMTPSLIASVCTNVAAITDGQCDWLMSYLRECETSTVSTSSSRYQEAAAANSLRRVWKTLFKFMDKEMIKFSKKVHRELRTYLNTEFTAKINKCIHHELKEMRKKALSATKAPLNVTRLQVFKDYAEGASTAILNDMLYYLRGYLKLHLQQGFVTATKSALTDFSKWLSRLDTGIQGGLQERYINACKQLQQLVAIDTTTTRAGFKYVSVTDMPCLTQKLEERYNTDDAEFLKQAMAADRNNTTTATVKDAMDVDTQ